MKKSLTAFFGKLTLGIAFVSIAAAANAQSATNVAAQPENAIVKYLGTQDDLIVFNVYYANPDGSKFLLTVKDQDGTQLYQNNFNDISFTKQFRLPRNEKDKIIFIIRDGKGADIVKSFEINVNSRFVQEVAVKKL